MPGEIRFIVYQSGRQDFRRENLIRMSFSLQRSDYSHNSYYADIQAEDWKDFKKLKTMVNEWWNASPGSFEESVLWRKLTKFESGAVPRDGEQLLFDWA